MEPARSGTRKWLAICLAAALAWAAFLAASGDFGTARGGGAPSLVAPNVPTPADFRWKLVDVAGKPVDFASYRGRPILLNLWATWCGPCLNEMPSIARLAADPRLKDKNVAFLCVSIDESAEALGEFMKGKDWKMTVLRASSIPPVFQTDGIPATFLIAPDGQVAAAEVGSARWDDASVVDFLERLAILPR